jgi:putative peptidoglycan lipid II flippase
MSLARDVTTVGSATMLSRLLGFFRDVGIAAVLGAGALSDAYFAALQVPNLFRRLLAEGALNSAFVPMWLRIRDRDASAARRFGETVLGTMLLALGVIAILCVIFAPTVVHLLAPGFDVDGERFAHAVVFVRLSIPYIAIAGLVAVAASVLNAEGRVAAAAFGIVIFNGVLLAAVLYVIVSGSGASEQSGRVLSIAIVIAGIAQFALVGAALTRMPLRPRAPSLRLSDDVRRFYMLAIPGVVAGGIPQLKLMAGAMVASSSQASVSWLYYANRLYELPLGIVSIAIASVLAPRIAASLRTGERNALAAQQSRAFEIALGLALPAAVGIAVLATPIAGGLFERGAFGPRDTVMVAAALAAIAAGLPGHVIEKVLGAISFAHEDTRTPMFAALAGLAAAVCGSLALFPAYGHVGVAAAIAISGWVGASLLTVILWRRGWIALERGAWRRLVGIVLSTAIMGAAIATGDALLTAAAGKASTIARAATLLVLVAAGLAVYLAALQIFSVARVRDIFIAVRHRL